MLRLRGGARREDTQRVRDEIATLCLQLADETAECAGPPELIDGEVRVSGEEACRRHLESLAEIKAEWDRFQSDACYIDDDGRVC